MEQGQAVEAETEVAKALGAEVVTAVDREVAAEMAMATTNWAIEKHSINPNPIIPATNKAL